MKYASIFRKVLLTGLIAGSIVFLAGMGKPTGPTVITSPSPIKVYSAEKGGYVMSETIVKTKAEWKKLLTPEQFYILREKGTERAFSGKLDQNHEHGIYRVPAAGSTFSGLKTNSIPARAGRALLLQSLLRTSSQDRTIPYSCAELKCSAAGAKGISVTFLTTVPSQQGCVTA